MSARMSCSMTVEPVEMEIKDVTRRHPDTWKNLKPGDRLTLIEKGMGLRKGERQRVLAEVEVVSNRVETLGAVTFGEIDREGLWPEARRAMDERGIHPIRWFQRFWADAHGHAAVADEDLADIECRRIEWRYL